MNAQAFPETGPWPFLVIFKENRIEAVTLVKF